jgi:lipopolysaccharide exporter
MGYTKTAIKGMSWLGGLRAATRGVSFLRTAVLARLLTPQQFGFFAVASLVLSLIELITETGINIILVQKKDSIDKYISTAWVVSIIRGFLIGAAIFVLSPFVASFFKIDEAQPLIALIALVPIIRGFINPARVKLVKDLRYRDEFLYSLSLFAVESIVTVVFAYLTKSATSIVYGLIAGALWDVALSFIVFRPWPTIKFQKPLFLEIIHGGKWLTGTGVASYLFQNIDNIVVGRLLGASSLGLYDVSYKISLLPLTEVTDVVGKAAFPVLVKISDDLPRLRRAYIKSVTLILVISLAIGTVLFLFPEQIIRIVLGEQWVSAAPVLRVLSILGVLRAVYVSIIHPLYALEKQKLVTVVFTLGLVVLAILIVPFVQRYELLGAAYAAVTATVLTLPLAFYYVWRELSARKS